MMTLGTNSNRVLQLAGMVVLIASCSQAGILSITHTGVGSGTIGTTTFTNASFTITDLADTAARQSFTGGFFIDDLSASIAITGVGTFMFTTGTRTFVNQSNDTVGFSRAGNLGADLFNGPTNAAFATWDMLSGIGPISGVGSLLQWSSSAVNTSGGVLVFANGSSDTRFQATLSGVPEPSSIALVGIGAIGLLGLALRRKGAL
ncbi:MAG TPA: PEP-CTERM sorting domain-containing protein [Bryobacteraceae bacterium]|jgi:hypothetical protein|nr:PEP-CTERM sorting domain-containing protein [Bryobacteraceae bacterium]